MIDFKKSYQENLLESWHKIMVLLGDENESYFNDLTWDDSHPD